MKINQKQTFNSTKQLDNQEKFTIKNYFQTLFKPKEKVQKSKYPRREPIWMYRNE